MTARIVPGNWSARLLLIVAFLPALAMGCGEPPTYPVSGTVTLDGQPLPDAFVSFVNTENVRSSAVARTDAQGNYTLKVGQQAEGMLPGMYEVRISTYQSSDTQANPPTKVVRERVPPRYNTNSDLRREVKGDQPNVINFELTKK